MKILLIHTYYQLKGGEDAVFEGEYNLLKAKHNVKKLVFKNSVGLKGLYQFLLSIYNPFSALKTKKILVDFKPDVVHIHNFHFAASPSIIMAVKAMNTPIVVTLHNFRLLCPSGTLFYNGSVFEDSINKTFPWLSVFNGVYRNSKMQTFWLAFTVWLHKKKGTWKKVDTYITLTNFSKELFIKSSFNIVPDRFVVKANFVELPVTDFLKREDHFLFVGRLSIEKGVLLLIEFFSKTNNQLHIAGDGPLKDAVVSASNSNKNIKYLGSLKKEQIGIEMKRCSALIFPSVWYEGMPMTIIEAFANETPVIANKLGAMNEMISDGYNGLHFDINNFNSFKNAIEYWLALSENNKSVFRANAKASYIKKYSPEVNFENIISIYDNVISGKVK